MKSIRKTAIVHDWLTGMRGGEIVLEAILDLFPEADIFTLLHNRGDVSAKIESRRIITSFIDRLPFKKTHYRSYLPLFPSAVESLDLRGYDLIISSSHCVARGVIPPPGTPHIAYIHSPMRYVWDMYRDYFGEKNAPARGLIHVFANYLRMWEASSVGRADAYVCNSAFVARRIERYYNKKAAVVHPPCIPDEHQVPQTSRREDFYLVVGAFAPYKRVDLALEAFRDWGRRLVVIGDGQDRKKLRSFDLPNVRFMGNFSREGIIDLYGRARGLIFPGVEDFGIVPVEAQSYGCPVIAFAAGGALETVDNGKTGVFFAEQTVESLREAILKNENIRCKREDFQKSIERFTEGKFKRGFIRELRKLTGE